MSAEIKDLSPKHVWGYFYDLTQIPRPTGHMEAVTRFMISFGEKDWDWKPCKMRWVTY